MCNFKNCDIGECRYAQSLANEKGVKLDDVGGYKYVYCAKLSKKNTITERYNTEWSIEKRGFIPRVDDCEHYEKDNQLYLSDVEIVSYQYDIRFNCPICGHYNEFQTTEPYFSDFEVTCESCLDTVSINTDD